MALYNANPTFDLGIELTSVVDRDAGAPTPTRRRQRSGRCDGDWLGRQCAGVRGANVPEGHGR